MDDSNSRHHPSRRQRNSSRRRRHARRNRAIPLKHVLLDTQSPRPLDSRQPRLESQGLLLPRRREHGLLQPRRRTQSTPRILHKHTHTLLSRRTHAKRSILHIHEWIAQGQSSLQTHVSKTHNQHDARHHRPSSLPVHPGSVLDTHIFHPLQHPRHRQHLAQTRGYDDLGWRNPICPGDNSPRIHSDVYLLTCPLALLHALHLRHTLPHDNLPLLLRIH